MKVVTVVGARPQFVKAAPVSRVLRSLHTEIVVHTGQHYDDEMSSAFFRDLEMEEPDLNLGVGSGSHGAQTAEMLRGLEAVLLDHEPDAVVTYGDTNSTLAASLAAAKVSFAGDRRPRLVHVEAGLRSFNPAMPEERNRIVADHLSDLLLAPTETAMAHLRREGLGARARLVGDVMADAFAWAADRAAAHLPPEAVGLSEFVLVTLHRAENVDDPSRLAAWMAALELDRPVIFPVHPRTRAALEGSGIEVPDNVRRIEPVGFLSMIALESAAVAVATDSGGVQKEAYLAGVPCITLRAETEWVETVEAGWNRVIGADPTLLQTTLADRAFLDRARERPTLYGDGRAAERIVAAIDEGKVAGA